MQQKITRAQYRRFGAAATIAIGLTLLTVGSAFAQQAPMGQGGNSQFTVTIDKYVDGQLATANNANSASFPMQSSWSGPMDQNPGNGTFSLGPTGFNSPNAYEAVTSAMDQGSSYATNEVTTGNNIVGATCSAGEPFALAGYTTGTTSAAAATAAASMTSPSFTNMTSNEYVDVWNTTCPPAVATSTLAAPMNMTPANGSTMTSAAFTSATWSAVNDNAGGITYVYQASNSSSTNADGSFANPVFTSSPLSTTSIATNNTLEGTYFWHVQATDASSTMSAWSTPTWFTINNATTGTTTPGTGQIGGNVNTATGTLAVDSIQTVKGNASADNTYADGLEYIFNVTVPTNEPNVAIQFSNWMGSNASDTIPVAGNMRVMSAQASNNQWVPLTGSDQYSSPAFMINSDLNHSEAGDQIQIMVQVKIPVGTANDSYTTNYAITSNP